MSGRLVKFKLWRSGGIQLGEVEAPSDSKALLDYAARHGISGELRGTYTYVISPSAKLYAVRARD
jgi:hypothetical protein